MPTLYDLTPIINLLTEQEPDELAAILDEMLLILVHYSDQQRQHYTHFADWYHQLRQLRDAFHQLTKAN